MDRLDAFLRIVGSALLRLADRPSNKADGDETYVPSRPPKLTVYSQENLDVSNASTAQTDPIVALGQGVVVESSMSPPDDHERSTMNDLASGPPSEAKSGSTLRKVETVLDIEFCCLQAYYEEDVMQDALGWRATATTLSFAVSDGASTSCRPEFFAAGLVEGFTSDEGFFRSDEARALWWTRAKAIWQEQVALVRSDMKPPEVSLLKREGAKATFGGVRIEHEPFLLSQAKIGDCFEIWTLADRMVYFDPPPPYNDIPDVLATTPDAYRDSWLHLTHRSSLPSRELILCTDAIGEYLVERHPWGEGTDVFSLLAGMTSEGFTEWCQSLRRQRLLKADDWTCIVVRFPEGLPCDEGLQGGDGNEDAL